MRLALSLFLAASSPFAVHTVHYARPRDKRGTAHAQPGTTDGGGRIIVPGICHLIIDVTDAGLERQRPALPLDFRIDPLPPHPVDPEGREWRLRYTGPWTIEQDDILDSFTAEVVTSWSRAGIPARLEAEAGDE